MKPKTARRFLNRNAWKIANLKETRGRVVAKRSIKPYLQALRPDIRKSEASRKAYTKFSIMI